MRRAHRRWHRRIWRVLPFLLIILVGAAIVFRPPVLTPVPKGAAP